jgi:hypothetical protein
MSEETKKKVVKGEKTDPCGCHVVEYSDDTGDITPCIFHGMLKVAACLRDAGNAMGAVAHRHRLELQQASVIHAAKKVVHPG